MAHIYVADISHDSKKTQIWQYHNYPQFYIKFVMAILTALRKFVGYVLALNITKNLNVRANINVYIEFSWINIAL